jgi:hypothetical protein
MHSETRNPSPHHHRRPKDPPATAHCPSPPRKKGKSPPKDTPTAGHKTKSHSWNKCPDCNERACDCILTSSADSDTEVPTGTPTVPTTPPLYRLAPHRSTEVPNDNLSEPKDAQKAFEMTPIQTMREKTKDAAALASLPRETFLHRIQTSPQAPPRPSPLSNAFRTLAKAAGDLNNFDPEDWALLTVQSQEWFNTKMKPAIKELKRSRRTTEWDTTTTCPNPQNTEVYYESIKREPKIRGINKCRCDERLQTKTKEFTRLTMSTVRRWRRGCCGARLQMRCV